MKEMEDEGELLRSVSVRMDGFSLFIHHHHHHHPKTPTDPPTPPSASAEAVRTDGRIGMGRGHVGTFLRLPVAVARSPSSLPSLLFPLPCTSAPARRLEGEEGGKGKGHAQHTRDGKMEKFHHRTVLPLLLLPLPLLPSPSNGFFVGAEGEEKRPKTQNAERTRSFSSAVGCVSAAVGRKVVTGGSVTG